MRWVTGGVVFVFGALAFVGACGGEDEAETPATETTCDCACTCEVRCKTISSGVFDDQPGKTIYYETEESVECEETWGYAVECSEVTVPFCCSIGCGEAAGCTVDKVYVTSADCTVK